ncbi:MAG: hypothetical protein ACTSRP_07560 [Candidatus Helarchaeota archaeon]
MPKTQIRETLELQDRIIKKLERDIKLVEVKLENKTKELEDLKLKYSELQEENSDIKSRLSYQLDKNKELLDKLNQLEADYNKIIQHNKDLVSQMLAKEKFIGSAETKMAYMSNQLIEKETVISDLKQQLKNVGDEKFVLEKNLNELNILLKERREELNKKEIQIKEMEKKIRELETYKSNNITTFEKLNLQLQNYIDRVKKLENELTEKDAELVEKEDKLNKLMDDFKQMEEKALKLEVENSNLRNEINELSSKLENLENEIKKYNVGQQIIIGRDEFIKQINDMVTKTKSSILLITPSIIDLKSIDFSPLNYNIQVRIATSIDLQSSQHYEILTNLQNQGFKIRNYELGDRWGVDRDGEEIFIAASGADVLGIKTDDQDAIKLYRVLISDAWLRGKMI